MKPIVGIACCCARAASGHAAAAPINETNSRRFIAGAPALSAQRIAHAEYETAALTRMQPWQLGHKRTFAAMPRILGRENYWSLIFNASIVLAQRALSCL